MRGEADVVEGAGKPDDGAVNGAMLSQADVDGVVLCLERRAYPSEVAAQVVALSIFQGKVEILRIAWEAVEETEASAAVKRQRREGADALQRFEGPCLDVLPGGIATRQDIVFADQRVPS